MNHRVNMDNVSNNMVNMFIYVQNNKAEEGAVLFGNLKRLKKLIQIKICG